MRYYIVTVKHDAGIARIRAVASSEERAIKLIMKSEGCPRSAIIKVETTESGLYGFGY